MVFQGIFGKPQKSCPHSYFKFSNLFSKPQPRKFSKFFENPTLNLKNSQTFLKTKPSTSEILKFQE